MHAENVSRVLSVFEAKPFATKSQLKDAEIAITYHNTANGQLNVNVINLFDETIVIDHIISFIINAN